MKTAVIHARIEPQVKRQAEGVLHELGLSPTEAIRIFYRLITLRRGLPFAVAVPNECTAATLEKSRRGEDVQEFESLDAMFQSWKIGSCNTTKQTAGQTLKPFVGKWDSNAKFFLSELEVKANGRFALTIVFLVGNRTRLTLSGMCNAEDTEVILRVQASSEKIETKLPFEIHGVLKGEALVLHDDPKSPEITKTYWRK